MEGSTKSLNHLLRALSRLDFAVKNITKVKVCLLAEDRERVVDGWESKVVNVPGIDVPETEKVSAIIGSTVVNLENLCLSLATRRGDRDKLFDELRVAQTGVIPTNEQIAAIADREEVMGLMDYLDLVNAPVDVDLESDRVWPISARIEQV